MKTKLFIPALVIVCFFLTKKSIAQITLEATYDYASTDLSIVTLEDIGMKYMVRNRVSSPGGRMLRFYNLDHSLWTTVDMNSYPTGWGPNVQYYEILYVSQYLFDTDSDVEFMFIAKSQVPYTGIYNIDGTLVQGFDSIAPWITPNIHTYQFPIYNTPSGTKLIMSKMGTTNLEAFVYGLQGTFTPMLSPFPEEVKNFNVYPNPSSSFTIVDYELPEGITDAYLNISDLNGNVLKTFRVDAYQKNILVNNDEIASGTYLYTITHNNKVLVSKKIEIIGIK